MNWEWIMGGAAIGAVAACWRSIKSFFAFLASLIVAEIEIPRELYTNLEIVAFRKGRPSRYQANRIRAEYSFRGRHVGIRYELLPLPDKGGCVWFGWVPVWIRARRAGQPPQAQVFSRSDSMPPGGANPHAPDTASVSYIRGTLSPAKLFRMAAEAQAETGKIDGAVGAYVTVISASNRHDKSDLSASRAERQFVIYDTLDEAADSSKAVLFYDDLVLTAVRDMERWRHNEDWYASRRIPWRRGYVLHGLPGCGKTALVVHISQKHRMPVVRFDLAGMTNQTFREYWESQVRTPSWPKIVLLEDIDGVFHGRTNVSSPVRNHDYTNMPRAAPGGDIWSMGSNGGPIPPVSDLLTFDTLINEIDGVTQSRGTLLFITTNKPELLDPALATWDPVKGEIANSRPGRIDRALRLGEISAANKRRMAEWILAGHPETIERIVSESPPTDTPAIFQERCVTAALTEFFKEGDDEKRDQV